MQVEARTIRHILFIGLGITGVLFALMAVACSMQCGVNMPPPIECDANAPPSIGATAQAMAICLSPNASSQEAAELLLLWQRVDNLHWGGAVTADLLPGSDAELILTYHADMENVTWNPQGKIAILQAKPNGWEVVFESPDPTDQATDGRETLAGNWSYHLATVGDVTGDGLDDLLIEQQWSNAHYGYVSHTKLFTADSAESSPLNIIYLEDGTFIRPNYAIVNQTVQSIIPLSGMDAITRTYQLDKNAFIMIEEMINTEAATLSATTAGGAGWYAYDRSCGFMCYQWFGLYQLQDSDLVHYDIPGQITSLKVLRDGHLYVGSSTEAIFRIDEGTLVNVLAYEYAPVTMQKPWKPIDMALSNDGDLWVAGELRLLHFGRNHSTSVYDLLAVKVMVAPDDSAWVLGWDGVAESDCCFYHIQEGEVREYRFDESLPVSAELEQQIRAMRQ